MSAEKAIYALLQASTGLLAVVPSNRIFAGVIPLNTVLPAISYSHISTVENTTIDANSQYGLVTSRIQVLVATKEYPTVKDVMRLIRLACNYKRGTFNGVIVNSVLRDIVSPDMADDEVGIYYQSIDFKVTFQELN